MTSTLRGARERARSEITTAIKDEARRQLAEEGAAKLSLRAVARALGMVSSALYRYFPSRDELLTALIVDAYDSVGAAAEAARDRTLTESPARAWAEVAGAVRAWALAHPHEYALIHGSPVPGYHAPAERTVPAAARSGEALIDVVRRAHAGPGAPAPEPVPTRLEAEAARMIADFAGGLPADAALALPAVWAQLYGLISFEVFGQFQRVVEERDAFFAHAVARLGTLAGIPEETPTGTDARPA
ncbi:TetR/AcrR family transcriptional regulator (plasmid) [Streptomyces sp. BI20]|uniref:TetR/AcrR family transcriptional regulator n=1 Tax=Streptomyces sp. BI20 TaxID=3403460 RepID=UPI003C72F6C5